MKRPTVIDFLVSVFSPACYFNGARVGSLLTPVGPPTVNLVDPAPPVMAKRESPLVSQIVSSQMETARENSLLTQRVRQLEMELKTVEIVAGVALEVSRMKHRELARERNHRAWAEDRLAAAEAECERLREEVRIEREARADLIGGENR